MSDGSNTQVVRYRQVRRDQAIEADKRRGDLEVAEACAFALARCAEGFHDEILFGGRRFCSWCGEVPHAIA